MGNAPGSPVKNANRCAAQPVHVLELRLAHPRMTPPAGRGGQPCALFAKVGLLEDRAGSRSVLWDEAVPVHLPSDESAVIVSLYAAEPGLRSSAEAEAKGEARLLAEICLPFGGPGGLSELGIRRGGPPEPLRLALPLGNATPVKADSTPRKLAENLRKALENFRPDGAGLVLSVCELMPETPTLLPAQGSAEWRLPPARRQLITLELQNQALQFQCQKLLGEAVTSVNADDETGSLSHLNQLQMIQQENEQLRNEMAGMQQKLQHTKATASVVEKQPKENADHDWNKMLHVMQQELAHCRSRQEKIHANYEDRVRGLQGQLLQEKGSHLANMDYTFSSVPTVTMQEQVAAMKVRLAAATSRRNDLKNSLYEAQVQVAETEKQGNINFGESTPVVPPSNPDIQRLLAQAEQHKVELDGLQQELVTQNDNTRGSERKRELHDAVEQLREELEELERVREDERVRSESEVRELKSQRDSVKDRLDDVATELQRLHSQAEALRTLQAQAEGKRMPSSSELAALRASNEKLASELEHIHTTEEARKQTIAELEREQDALVEKITLMTAQSVPQTDDTNPEQYVRALEMKAAELFELVMQGEQSCKHQRAEVERLRSSGLEAQNVSEDLRRSYDALQQSSDDRMMRNPEHPGRGFSSTSSLHGANYQSSRAE